MTTDWIELTTLQDVAKAQADGWEIEYSCATEWHQWNGNIWNIHNQHRARPRQPKMKTVKMLCYFTGLQIVWREEDYQLLHGWIRIPAQDIEIEIPEGV